MLPSILIVDDEIEVLNTLKRLLRKAYNVFTFQDPDKAINFYERNPTQLVISDMRMPKVSGAEFLKRIYKINKRSKRLVLTGYADTELAIKAINDGHISMFLSKPWNNDELKSQLAGLILELKNENKKLAVIKKLKVNNKRLHEDRGDLTHSVISEGNEQVRSSEEVVQLKSSNNQLLHLSANLVSIQTHDISGHTYRVANQAKALSEKLNLKELTCIRVYLAALFYRVGISSLPTELSNKLWFQMTPQERNEWIQFPQASADVIATTDILNASADIVRHLYENVDGTGLPSHLTDIQIPVGSKILSIVIYYDLLVAGVINGKITRHNDAIAIMRKRVGKNFDGILLNKFAKLIEAADCETPLEVPKNVEALEVGMCVAQDVMNTQHQKLLCEKTILNETLIERLTNYQQQTQQLLIIYIKI